MISQIKHDTLIHLSIQKVEYFFIEWSEFSNWILLYLPTSIIDEKSLFRSSVLQQVAQMSALEFPAEKIKAPSFPSQLPEFVL